MTTQTPATEERLSRLEGAYEQVNERLGDLRAAVDRLAQGQAALREEMHQGQAALREEVHRGDATLREEIRSLREEMRSLRTTMLLLIGGVWTTMIGGFIAIFTRF